MGKNHQTPLKKFVEEEDNNDDYQVEQILKVGKDPQGRTLYLVKWEGYPHEENTWETPEDLLLDGHVKAVREFEKTMVQEKPSKKTEKSDRARSKTPPSRKVTASASEKKTRTPRRLNLDPPPPVQQQQKPHADSSVTSLREAAIDRATIKPSQNQKPLTSFLTSFLVLGSTTAVALHAEEFQDPYSVFSAQIVPFIAAFILLQIWGTEDSANVQASRACLWAAFDALLKSSFMTPVPWLSQACDFVWHVDLARAVGGKIGNWSVLLVTLVVFYFFATSNAWTVEKQVISLVGLWGAISGVERWAEKKTFLNFAEAIAGCFALIGIHATEQIWPVGSVVILAQSLLLRSILRSKSL